MYFDEDNFFEQAKVGKLAPTFEMDAVLAEGESINRFGKVSLEENIKNKKWTVLYFYPLDFTFVCPTEIREFDNLYPEFKKLNAEVIACSTDSVFSHLAWQDRQDLGRLNHPHASDNNHIISKSYGVYDEEKGVAWRGTFIIDPDGILKAAHVNHGEGGRNVQEILRTLQVFIQEREGKLVPCGWTPGKDFVDAK